MSEIIPFITIKNCLKAIEYYKEILDAQLDGKITMMNDIKGYDDHKFKDMVGHATLRIGTSTFFVCDTTEPDNHKVGNNIQLVLNFEDEATLRLKFESIVKEGRVVWDLEEVFWGALFGTVQDKFGVYWQLYYGHK